jgi:hypothetical protein
VTTDTSELDIRGSPRGALSLLVMAAAFLGLAAAGAATGGRLLVLLLTPTAVICGLLALLALSRPQRLQTDGEGFRFTGLTGGGWRVRWDEVAGFHTFGDGERQLGFRYRDPARGLGGAAVLPGRYTVPAATLAELMNARLERARRTQSA